ncbi:hypothetical protein BDW74DRAFT_78902 [Aspergillus multicolor]|uniref:uncharacterized protein n=1 Tax=Aspergillus multicolor TaxID=41759 RepID=UPI003CCDCEAC
MLASSVKGPNTSPTMKTQARAGLGLTGILIARARDMTSSCSQCGECSFLQASQRPAALQCDMSSKVVCVVSVSVCDVLGASPMFVGRAPPSVLLIVYLESWAGVRTMVINEGRGLGIMTNTFDQA